MNISEDDLGALQNELRETQMENIELLQKLDLEAKAMGGMGVDVSTIVGHKLEVLLDSIFDPETRLKFELKFEKSLNGQIKEQRSLLNQAKLTQGTGSPGGGQGGLWVAGS